MYFLSFVSACLHHIYIYCYCSNAKCPTVGQMKLHKSVYELWNKLEECCAVATFLKQELDVLGVVHCESIAAGQGVEQWRLPFGDENKAAVLKDNNWIELSVSEVLL